MSEVVIHTLPLIINLLFTISCEVDSIIFLSSEEMETKRGHNVANIIKVFWLQNLNFGNRRKISFLPPLTVVCLAQ